MTAVKPDAFLETEPKSGVSRCNVVTGNGVERPGQYSVATHAPAVFTVSNEVMSSSVQLKVFGTDKLAPEHVGAVNFFSVLDQALSLLLPCKFTMCFLVGALSSRWACRATPELIYNEPQWKVSQVGNTSP